ncbi:MAG TPA: DEAD/DEAH box helicase family protein [Nitrososphaeraceae archaeon]|nr:DEAD/DEAH box helicase family protein [Nitrososphaeraceae archaeon]
MQRTVLTYDNGSIIIRGGISHIPYASFDPRTNSLRAQALYYKNILDYLNQSEIEYDDSHVLDLIPSPNIILDQNNTGSDYVDSDDDSNTNNDHQISLRDYQQKALDMWIKAGKRGCIVLPTGAGKTVVGVKAIEIINSASLVIVPTIDLMDQWTSVLSKYFNNVKIGNLGGGSDDIQAITVCTYDSAYIRASNIGNKFALIIFDEVHHLAAPGYRSIAEQFASPFRLGLTATIEREDNLHKDFPRLVGGGIVFEARASDLAKNKHLSSFEIERRHVDMLPEEVEEYKKNFHIYNTNLMKVGLKMNYSDSFRKLIMISGRSSIARQAVLARNKAMDIALNSKSKIEELREILSENKGKKTIIFTQHNKLVYKISDQFLIPFITYKSSKAERQDALQGFKDGRYTAVVTSKVLDEGVDVPDAEIGIIVSGTGSSREFIQRLGRLLRPKPFSKDKAKLIEIVSSGTREMGTSAKRKRAFKKIDI